MDFPSRIESGTNFGDASPVRTTSRQHFDSTSSRNLQFSDGRRRSDPHYTGGFQTLEEDDDTSFNMQAKRSARKLKTMPAPAAGGCAHDEVHLEPTALARLHKLHEAFKAEFHDTKAHEDFSDAAMNAAWGAGGSWHMYGDQPLEREKPLNLRSFKMWPANLGKAESHLTNLGVAAVNTKGRKGWTDTCPGQDNCSVSHLTEGGWEVYCVMDGHGPGGEWPSTRAVRTIPYLLQTCSSCKTMLKQGKVASAMCHAFEKAQEDLVRESFEQDVELMAAGCTAVCVIKDPTKQKIWVATAGDSRVILLVPGFGAVNETQDHKPSVDSERERCERMGCDVTRTEHSDGFVEERVNIAGEDFPGLCMTRSLGDLAVKEYGVLAEPEVVEWPLDKFPDALLLAASDGVWEFLTNERVSEIVLGALEKGASYQQACNKLIKASQDQWREKEDFYCDDITVVLAGVGHRVSRQARGSCCGAGIFSKCTLM